MKYCEEYAALISAWLDGELNEEETGRLQAHLFTCPGCRAYLADLKAMGRAFPTLEEVEVRVSPQFAPVAHIDYDEANACGFRKGDRGLILTK